MNRLIIGANGQLGRALAKRYPDARALTRAELDLADETALIAFDWSGIDIVYNAAAYTKVDAAEDDTNHGILSATNIDGPRRLAMIAAIRGFIIVHVSSDYVYDGWSEDATTEETPPGPLNCYGMSKLAADIAIESATPRHYILRSSWVVGDGPNFVRTMAKFAGEKRTIKVVANEFGRPTFTTTMVEAIDHLVESDAPYGLYHCTNDGAPTNWAGLARAVYSHLGADSQLVQDVTATEYHRGKALVAPRPRNSLLDLSRLTATGFEPRLWRNDLFRYLQDTN